MNRIIKVFCILSIGVVNILAQKDIQKNQYVEVPRDVILKVIAVQPGCPVRFENVKTYAGVMGGGFNSYELRNIGTKPILSITVASTTGSIYTWAKKSGVLVMPGKLVEETEDNRTEIIPLTNELREKLNLKNSMKSVGVLMISNVKFSDGTEFNDEKTYKSLMLYYEKIQDAIYQSEENKTSPK